MYFSPDGKNIVSSSSDKTIRIWDVDTCVEIKKFEGHTHSVMTATYSSDSKYIISASWDRTIRLWNVESGLEVGKISRNGNYGIRAVYLSPNGKRIVWQASDNIIRMTDVNGLHLERPSGHIYPNPYSLDGKQVVMASGNKIIGIYDAETGSEIKKLEGHTGDVTSAFFSPDGKYIISASKDKTIRIWDAESGKGLKQFKGHSEAVTFALFSPDSRRIVSGSWDKTIRIWNFPRIEELVEETQQRFKDYPLKQEELKRYYLE